MDLTNLFQVTPWDRYAGVCGALTTVVCIRIGFIALFVNSGGESRGVLLYFGTPL